MNWLRMTLAIVAALVLSAGFVLANTYSITITPSGSPTTFTALHTYYIAPLSSPPAGWSVGSDSNNGTSQSTPWATPNHSIVCGDVIIVAPKSTYSLNASYNNGAPFAANMPTPSSCPSTSGGIDGTGGIYFAIVLCGGTDIGSTNGCVIDGVGNTDGYYSVEFEEGQSNWAFEGFYFDTGCTNTGSPGSCSRSFGSRTCNGNQAHHIALINSITTNSMQGYGDNDCGNEGGVATDFWDYIASVGVILQNSNSNGDYQGGICVGAIDFGGGGNHDTAAGTHSFMYNNYGIKNQTTSCPYDGEAFYIDSPEAHLFNQQAVIANNIAYQSTDNCIAWTASDQNANGTDTGTYKAYNNTCYDNGVMNGSRDEANGDNGEFNLDSNGGDFSTNPNKWTMTVQNNIVYNDHAHSPNGNVTIYASDTWGKVPAAGSGGSLTFGGTGNENVFKSSATGCNGACDTGNNVNFNNQSLPAGANFYETPSFANTSDLISNHTGVPNCTGFVNTTACLGYDANTNTLTSSTVIADLQASCADCTGKGFQLPSTTCVSSGPINTDFPVWLKGIVYLHWTGTAIVQNHDLATTPCGL